MTAEREGTVAAERFRRDHHLGQQPLGDLVAIIEQATGIDVAVLDVGPDEHGLTMRDPDRDAVFIAVARTLRPMRQRSTLAHELGHVIFEDWNGPPGSELTARTPEEIRADAFARHLLIPISGLGAFLSDREPADRTDLSAVVQRFVVSPAIAAIAMRQAGYIDDATKDKWKTFTTPAVAARFGWADHYRALQADSNQSRAPQRLLARATQGYLEHVVSVQTLARLRRMGTDVVEAELRDAGLVPAEQLIVWSDPADLPDSHVDLSGLDDEAEDQPG